MAVKMPGEAHGYWLSGYAFRNVGCSLLRMAYSNMRRNALRFDFALRPGRV